MATTKLQDRPETKQKFQYRPGHNVPGLKAQEVGEHLERLRSENGGIVQPEQVVDDARPEDSPLHHVFEWDDDVAAEKYRIAQARNIIRSVNIIMANPMTGQDDAPRLAFVSVSTPFMEGTGYSSTREAFADSELRARLIARERAVLMGWQARNNHLEELATLVDAVKAALAADQAQEAKKQSFKRYRQPRERPDAQPPL
jgi:hypothetical protein